LAEESEGLAIWTDGAIEIEASTESEIASVYPSTLKEIHMKTSIQTSYLPLAARLLLAPLFLLSGVAKLADPSGTIAYIASTGASLPELGYAIALAVEVGGGALLLLGFKTRAVAGAMALFSVGAAVLFHSNFTDQNQMIHFMKNVAIAGGMLQLVAFGAGGFSLDAIKRPQPVVANAAAT
jgi:putative oxidoreductase